MASSRGGSINSLSSDINVDLSETWKKKGKKVSDLIGSEEIIEELESCFKNHRDFPGRYPPATCILLFGVPGTGKTAIVEKVCEKLEMALLKVETSQLFSKYTGDSEKMLQKYFEAAEELSMARPVVVFIDEIDSICLSRRDDGGDGGTSRRVTNLLMTKISDITLDITVVGATNFPGSLDKALLSRVCKFIKVSLPDINTRIQFIKNQIHQADFEDDLRAQDLQKIASDLQNFSFRDLQRLWYKSCDILFAHLRRAHFKNQGSEVCKFIPCFCEENCTKYKIQHIPSDAVEMKITCEILMKARSFVTSTVTDQMVREIEYFSENYKSIPKSEPKSAESGAHQSSSSGGIGAEMFVAFLLFVIAIVGLIFYY